MFFGTIGLHIDFNQFVGNGLIYKLKGTMPSNCMDRLIISDILVVGVAKE